MTAASAQRFSSDGSPTAVESFQAWKPSLGRVFESTFAFDCETTLISEDRPWDVPEYVLGAAFDGRRGYFIRREHVHAFFSMHSDVEVVMHHAVFDLAVIHKLAPHLAIYDRVERGQVWDTQLQHRLFVLAAKGHTASGSGESTLERCARDYLGLELDKEVRDSAGDLVRLSYGKYLGRPPQEIECIYLEYLALDVVATYRVFGELKRSTDQVLAGAGRNFGYVDERWLSEQVRRWGPQTHHIQLKAAIVLESVSSNGLHIDQERRNQLAAELAEEKTRRLEELRGFGYSTGPGSDLKLQQILAGIEAENPGLRLPRTKTGQYSCAAKDLDQVNTRLPFIECWRAFQHVKKQLEFVSKLSRQVVHPSFNVLVETGRTSSFGEINAQNLPRGNRIRSCVVPSSERTFIIADYTTIELVTLAQACPAQFHLPSKMAEALNRGEDLHCLLAARISGKQPCEVTEEERQRAKPINFGKPGGMGDPALRKYAKKAYGLDLSIEAISRLSDAWLEAFPEMREFLLDRSAVSAAETFGLTAQSYREHTGSDQFMGRPQEQRPVTAPLPALGGMFLKAIRDPHPATRAGRPYSEAEVEFFWARLHARIDLVPAKWHDDILGKRASHELFEVVCKALDASGVFTLTGRLRANCSYTSRHNTIFQGLAADGAKLALWLIWRAGYRIVNFIHDEVVVEIPIDSDQQVHLARIRELMIEGMKLVVPDVRVDVKAFLRSNWTKPPKPPAVPAGPDPGVAA